MWNCSHFEGLRGDLAQPRDKAAERLFALPVGRLPRAPACIDASGFHDELVDAVAGHAHRRRLVVATDGSSKDFVGAMGFAIHEPGCRLVFGDAYEDQQPYRLEVTAIWHLLRAISAAKDRSSGLHPWVCQEVICVVDCESAIMAIEGKRDFNLTLVLQDIRHFRQRLLGQGIDVSFVWCPSHGNRPNWAPPLGLDPQTLRELNTAADDVAGQCMQLDGMARRDWPGFNTWRLLRSGSTVRYGQWRILPRHITLTYCSLVLDHVSAILDEVLFRCSCLLDGFWELGAPCFCRASCLAIFSRSLARTLCVASCHKRGFAREGLFATSAHLR